MKNLLLLLIISSLFGCRFFSGPKSYYLAMMNYKVPDGSPIFKKGYSDGCESGLYSRGNVLYRVKYKGHRYDPTLIDHPEYKFAFGRGYGYCFTLNTAGTHTGGADEFIYSKSKGMPFEMGRADYNDTINYEKGTWSNPLNIKYGGVNGIWGSVQSPKGFSVMGSHPLYGTPNDEQIFGW